MKKILYIFLAAALALTACRPVEPETKFAEEEKEPVQVTISFPIAIPNDGVSTKAMGNVPNVENIYVAVFGSSGYFSEWVPAEWALNDDNEEIYTQYAKENETIYNLKVKLTTSPSRLSLHIIANSPLSEPPITGVSSDDLEAVVMSKVRSKIGVQPNDAYWQKIVLPFGVKDSTIVTNGVEQPYFENGERVPTKLTIEQFKHWNPIPLVRNFARIRLKLDKAASGVNIDRIGLAYAPAEGSVAPILPNTYTANQWGEYISIADDDNTTTFWNESFYMAYPTKTLDNIDDAPYNFKGYSPMDQKIGTYPASLEEMTPWSKDSWENDYLYVYERAKPRAGQRPTRVLIHAQNGSDEPYKYYALDMVDASGDPLVLLRNFTYTVTLKQLAAGTGDATIAEAADATAADVSSDDRAADLTEVSDGYALIATSYIDTTAIKAGKYSVMYRFVPDVDTKVQSNNPSTTSSPVGVSLKFGYNNGVDGFIEGANSANGNAFASDPTIELNSDGTAKLYVRSGNGWAAATAAQIADSAIEKWSRINYTTTTAGTGENAAVDANGYYQKNFTKTIRIIGNKADGGRVYRDVQINLIRRKTMLVQCLDTYIEEEIGAPETVRIFIPNDITRSMFPLEFKIQAEAGSLTPRDGDNLPVSSGKSIIPGKETQSAFFFIKTLTRSDYDAARDTVINGVQLKYFDCKFKSNKASSATTVYAYNEYFNEDYDSFQNYTMRKFSVESTLGALGVGQNVTQTFRMDYDHRNGASVWNDGAITATSRVIPKEVTIKMEGIQPRLNEDGTAFVDTKLTMLSTGVYLYHVDGTNTAPSEVEFTLNLTAGSADSYSIVLSTSTITPNPKLYEEFSITGEITKSKITGAGFTNTSGNAITSIRREAGLPVQFRFTYGGTPVPVTFKLQGLTPAAGSGVTGPDANGNYTYTPTGSTAARVINFTTTDATTECKLTDFAVASDYTEMYSQPNPNSFSLERRNRRWVTDSYTINLTNSDSYTSAPQNVVFNNVESTYYDYDYDYYNETYVYYYYKAMGTRTGGGGPGGGQRKYYNGSFIVTAPSSLTDSRITGIEMEYYSGYYDDRTVTVTGDVSATRSSAGMTSWSSSSTGDGNGDNTVTVTMECSANTWYDGYGRNRLTGLTVHYGYWTEN